MEQKIELNQMFWNLIYYILYIFVPLIMKLEGIDIIGITVCPFASEHLKWTHCPMK